MKRRAFLLGSAAVVGGFAIGYRAIYSAPRNPLEGRLGDGQTALNPYVIVDQSGVTIITPRAEMGQGIHTGLATLVAEELDVAVTEVRVEHGPASDVYANRRFFPGGPSWKDLLRTPRWQHKQLTGGQTSTQDGYFRMRQAGAAARITLVQAAAERLGVDASSLRTDNGAVLDGTGNRIPYAELAPRAAELEPPQDPPLKPREEWRQLGRPVPRVDMVSKCTGTAEYAIDVRLPGMLYGTARLSPHLGGAMERYDASRAESMPGVRKVVPLETGVVVVATNTWYALEAAKAVDITWGPAPYPATTAEHRAVIAGAFGGETQKRMRDDGDVDAALAGGDIIEGEYAVPYLAHATMEPMNAVALLEDGRLDIWAGTQYPTRAAYTGVEITGVDPEDVHVHTTYMGGGFGRRLESDFIATAVHAARALEGTPVKVTWSREEDITHDRYRPMALARFRARVADGEPVALDLMTSVPPLFRSYDIREKKSFGEDVDTTVTIGAWEQPYRLENYRVTGYAAPQLLTVGWWRGVGETQNGFFHETVMDELAHAAGADPLLMRLSLIKDPRFRAVLESVAEMSNWGSPLPDGHGRGVAFLRSSGAPTAQVIEIQNTPQGIRVLDAWIAVDVGVALDPRNIEGQLEGALVYGLTAAMMGEITVTDGKVDQVNFHDYPLMRMYQMPRVHVSIHESSKRIFGVGEAAVPTAAPALGNAIFAATGQRLREMPFGKSVRFI